MTEPQQDDIFWQTMKRLLPPERFQSSQVNDQVLKQSGRKRMAYEKGALGIATVLLSLSAFWDLRINGSVVLLFINQWPEIVLLLFVITTSTARKK